MESLDDSINGECSPVPIYEYACQACGHEFEELSRSSDRDSGRRCLKCGAVEVTRKLSVFAAHHPSSASTSAGSGGCGRCGDPAGPCSNDWDS